MKTVHKYTLEVLDIDYHNIPAGAEFLSVQVQHGVPCVWVLVDPEESLRRTKIIIHGTGHNADDVEGMKFVGTFQLYDGQFVGHVWVSQ